MAIQIDAPDLMTLPEAARTLPGKVAPATIWRWATCGRNGHRLPTLRLGRCRYTSKSALQRFLQESDTLRKSDAETVPMASKSEAEKYCEAEGL